MSSKKHEDICGLFVPELNNVGVAWIKCREDMSSYVSKAESTSSPWIPSETRMNKYCGVSTGVFSTGSRNKYDFSSVLNPK